MRPARVWPHIVKSKAGLIMLVSQLANFARQWGRADQLIMRPADLLLKASHDALVLQALHRGDPQMLKMVCVYVYVCVCVYKCCVLLFVV